VKFLAGQVTIPELLHDPDRLRELIISLDLSKKNRAFPAICVIVAVLVDLNDQVSCTKKGHRSKFASAILSTLPC